MLCIYNTAIWYQVLKLYIKNQFNDVDQVRYPTEQSLSHCNTHERLIRLAFYVPSTWFWLFRDGDTAVAPAYLIIHWACRDQCRDTCQVSPCIFIQNKCHPLYYPSENNIKVCQNKFKWCNKSPDANKSVFLPQKLATIFTAVFLLDTSSWSSLTIKHSVTNYNFLLENVYTA